MFEFKAPENIKLPDCVILFTLKFSSKHISTTPVPTPSVTT